MACPVSATFMKANILAPILFLNPLHPNLHLHLIRTTSISPKNHRTRSSSLSRNCSNSTISSALSWSSETDQEEDEEYEEYTEDEDEENGNSTTVARTGHAPPMRMRRSRYRKLYPGEKNGVTEEMRFVAMKLKNSGKPKKMKGKDGINGGLDILSEEDNDDGESFEASVEGFLKYLVDSKHVFSTIERIVDESSDVSYVYFRKTGLERAECLSRDLEWFCQEGNSIPEPSNPGIIYANYLEEISENNPALFMCHFYNIYFSHIAGGQVIAKKVFYYLSAAVLFYSSSVSKKLVDGRELEFFKWEGNEEELLRGVREKLNMLGEHWSRDVKNKCLREATKAFRFLGQIVRLTIL